MNYPDDMDESAADADQRVRQVLMRREIEAQDETTSPREVAALRARIAELEEGNSRLRGVLDFEHARSENLAEAQRNGQRFRDECERLQTLAAKFQGEADDTRAECERLKLKIAEWETAWAHSQSGADARNASYEARIANLQSTIKDMQEELDKATQSDEARHHIMTTGVGVMKEALQTMLGIFDNPIARRRISGEMAEEARAMARKALGKE
jgi:chromosome segregation ATPase